MNQQQISIADLFTDMGYSYYDMNFDEPINVESHGYEVLTQDYSGNRKWDLIKKIVRKSSTDTYRVEGFNLNVSPLHKFWACVDDSNPHWIEATALLDCKNVKLLHQDLGWVDAKILHLQEKIDILDIEVENSHSYFSNGILSHNTMYGDPTTTPGGKAIPFHSSVRISLTSGMPVKDKAGNIIGIHVICTIKKNKVAPPFKKCEFDIIFGKGIVEHEYIFDEVRTYCKENKGVTRDGLKINISGEGAWKELVVSDEKTGEIIKEKKFYKSDFGSLMKDEEYKKYVMTAIDAALTINPGTIEQIIEEEITSDE